MTTENLPLISVGMPCYNRPKEMRLALESLINQTYKNIEIIVSDNGSPDPEVQKIGEEFARKDSRVNYYRQTENMGGIYNAKFVLDRAHGKYFMFAADDDFWDEEYIYILFVEHRIHKNVVLAASEVTFVDKDLNMMFPKPIPEWFNWSRFNSMLFMISSHHWAYAKSNMVYGLYKRDFLLDLKLYEGCSYEIGNDVLTLMRVISKGHILYVQRPLMYKGFEKFEENIFGHFHIFGPVRWILNKSKIRKNAQHDSIDEFTKSASDIISESGFNMIQQIVLKSWNQINRIRLMVLF